MPAYAVKAGFLIFLTVVLLTGMSIVFSRIKTGQGSLKGKGD
jgi:hypothetical protein